MVQIEEQQQEGSTNRKGGWCNKCNDSHIAEVLDLDFPSKKSRQNCKMVIKKEWTAQLHDCKSWGIAVPVAQLLQMVRVTPGIPNKPWHAQNPIPHRGGNISPQQQPALFHWMPLPCSLNRYQLCGCST